MGENDIQLLAKAVVDELKKQQHPSCDLTPEEQEGLRDILRTKKRAVNATLTVVGLIIFWTLKDSIGYILDHLKFVWGR